MYWMMTVAFWSIQSCSRHIRWIHLFASHLQWSATCNMACWSRREQMYSLYVFFISQWYPRSKGNVFTSMYQEFCPQGHGRCRPPGQTPYLWVDPRQTPPPQADIPHRQTPPGQTSPTSDDPCSGQYTSYWNSFLFKPCLHLTFAFASNFKNWFNGSDDCIWRQRSKKNANTNIKCEQDFMNICTPVQFVQNLCLSKDIAYPKVKTYYYCWLL